MKFDKFIATFIMMNIVLLMAVVFTSKSDILMQSAAEIIYGKKVAPERFASSPKEDYHPYTPTSEDIYSNTYLTRETISKSKALPPYERAVYLVKSFSLMGDGICQTGKTITEKINNAAKKEGCAKDYAQIFMTLAGEADLTARLVSNGIHYGAEIFDGNSWIYIDPYFAMSISSEDSLLSFTQFAEKMLTGGWMRFNYFGGENHCMSGKDISKHPYFSDVSQFSSVFVVDSGDVAKMLRLERQFGNKTAVKKYLFPFRNGADELYYTNLDDGPKSIIHKYTAGLLALLATIFAGTEIVLPVYYLTSLLSRLSKKN